jgi:16S rRNA G966 N2-methylase RsmD
LRQNFEAAGFADGLQLRIQDVFTAMTQLAAAGEQFDLILADPPYGEKNLGTRSQSYAQQLLDDSSLPSLLSEQGLLVLGHAKRDTLTLPESWQEKKMLKHGDNIMRFLGATHNSISE